MSDLSSAASSIVLIVDRHLLIVLPENPFLNIVFLKSLISARSMAVSFCLPKAGFMWFCKRSFRSRQCRGEIRNPRTRLSVAHVPFQSKKFCEKS